MPTKNFRAKNITQLFSGHCNTWPIHLRAATDVFRGPFEACWAELKLMGLSSAASSPDTTLDKNEFPTSEDDVASRFLWGVVIWLDIISCITTGKPPQLQSVHNDAISPHSPIQLEYIMGCKNWAMIQIARIAVLQEDKMKATHDGIFDPTDFEKRADVIRRELRNWLTQGFLGNLRISNTDPQVSHPAMPSTTLVTRIFTLAAFIYLHVIVSGFQLQTDELNTTIWEAMTLLRTQFPAASMHTIVCPLYIIGSVVKDEDRYFFRKVLSTAPLLEPSLKHRSKILGLLEQIWNIRDTTTGSWTWDDSIRLSHYSLLLL